MAKIDLLPSRQLRCFVVDDEPLALEQSYVEQTPARADGHRAGFDDRHVPNEGDFYHHL
ncbi:MAG: hypothetical protein LBO71_01970 [Prevotellaceae bacterium]|nr:hypothetical protein [Prevotellaceae bacterium]